MAKISVLYLGGAVAHERAKSLMIGVVAATLIHPAAGLAIDTVYFMATGLRP